MPQPHSGLLVPAWQTLEKDPGSCDSIFPKEKKKKSLLGGGVG